MRNKCIFVQEFPGGTMISAHPQCTGISCYTQRTLISMVRNTHHLKESEGKAVFVPLLLSILCLCTVCVCIHAWRSVYTVCVDVCVQVLYVLPSPLVPHAFCALIKRVLTFHTRKQPITSTKLDKLHIFIINCYLASIPQIMNEISSSF